MNQIYFGLGSNIGDRLYYLAQAINAINQYLEHDCQLSPIYQSDALLKPGAPKDWNQPFLNMVAVSDSKHSPEQWLHYVKNIESMMGRAQGPVWSPRIIDIDILAYGDMAHSTPELTIPHPQLHLRDFVLAPWNDLNPDWSHPQKKQTIGQLHQHNIQHNNASKTTYQLPLS